MNKVTVPSITFKENVTDEKRVEMAYSRIFELARRNILTRQMSKKYTEVHEGKAISDHRGSSKIDESKQKNGISFS